MGNICGRRAQEPEPMELPGLHDAQPILAIASAGGRKIVTGGEDKCICLWDCVDGRLAHRWAKAHQKGVSRLGCLQAESLTVSGGRDGGLRVWQHDHGRHIAELSGHQMAVTGLAVLGATRWVMSGSRDYAVKLWDLATTQQVGEHRMSRNVITHMRQVPGEVQVAQTSEDLHVYIWDARTVKVAQTMSGMVHIPQCIDCCTDGNLLVTSHNGSDGEGCEVMIWDRRKGEPVTQLLGHSQSANLCAFLPQTQGAGQLVASAAKDATLRVWDVTEGECVLCEPYPGGQCSAMEVLTVAPGADPASWEIPGYKRSFNGWLCGANLSGGVNTWGLRSRPGRRGNGAQLEMPLIAFSG